MKVMIFNLKKSIDKQYLVLNGGRGGGGKGFYRQLKRGLPVLRRVEKGSVKRNLILKREYSIEKNPEKHKHYL